MSDVKPVKPLDVELALGFKECDIDRSGREHVVELIQRLATTAKALAERLARVEPCPACEGCDTECPECGGTSNAYADWQGALRSLEDPP